MKATYTHGYKPNAFPVCHHNRARWAKASTPRGARVLLRVKAPKSAPVNDVNGEAN